MQTKQDLPQFTGLRGIAALLVLFYHVRTPQGLELYFGVFDPFSKFGRLGVDVFFVLSGFVITYVYGQMFADGFDGRALRSFAVARFARLYPLHFVMLFVMLGVYAIALHAGVQPTETSGYSWEGLLLSFLLVQQWFHVVSPNPGSWSISVELANYLMFPLMALTLSLRLPRHWPTFAIVIGAILLETIVTEQVFRGMVEFIMGSAAYVQSTRFDPRRLSKLAGVVFVLPFVASYVVDRELPGLAAFCFAITMLLLCGRDMSVVSFRRLCSSKSIVFIGDISYSVYLLQWLVWVGWKHVLARLLLFAGHPYLMVSCVAGSLILCSIVSYYVIEVPSRKFLRDALMPTKQRPHVAATG